MHTKREQGYIDIQHIALRVLHVFLHQCWSCLAKNPSLQTFLEGYEGICRTKKARQQLTKILDAICSSKDSKGFFHSILPNSLFLWKWHLTVIFEIWRLEDLSKVYNSTTVIFGSFYLPLTKQGDIVFIYTIPSKFPTVSDMWNMWKLSFLLSSLRLTLMLV